ncbi:hypothetical protein [Sulfitobacter aestuariivivens]|uniref:hypothetical protein n=1 Tax=Sulfitobacter aestuariivivens TaxID=2766981 RepID=UPI00360EEB3C
MSRAEFVALVAMMFATVAFSMDAMLPALPEIAAELSPLDPERAPLVLTTFFLDWVWGRSLPDLCRILLGASR